MVKINTSREQDDELRLHNRELQDSISALKAQHHEELTKARLLNEQLQNEMKIKDIKQSEKLTKSELLIKQLENDIMALKVKHSEELMRVRSDEDLRQTIYSLRTYIISTIKAQHHKELTKAQSLNEQLQNDIKIKEIEQSKFELLIKQLENDIMALKVKHSEELIRAKSDDDLREAIKASLQKYIFSVIKAQNDEELANISYNSSLYIQLQNDIKDCKIKEMEQSQKLLQSELLVKQFKGEAKHSETLINELRHARLQFKKLQNVIKFQNDNELANASSFIKQLQKDLKVKEMEQSQELAHSKSLIEQLESDINILKAKHSEMSIGKFNDLSQARLEIKKLKDIISIMKFRNHHELVNASSLIKQLQNDISNLQTKEMEHSQKLTQSESLVKQLENDIEALNAKHLQELRFKHYKTESKLQYLLSLLELVYVSYNSNGIDDDGSLWPLILFMSNEVSDQVAPAAILKMSDYAKRKENKEQWYSKPFFAFLEGYQMSLIVYADGNGEGEGTHVSVYLYLMKGPHDDKLEQSGHWPLRGTFTIELLNQLSDNNHFSCVEQFHHYFCNKCTNRVIGALGFVHMVNGLGRSHFISHDKLLHHNSIDYGKNDSLIFRISYEDVEPPYKVAPVTFKITNFCSQWLKNKRTWYSSSFFAFVEGYQMVLKVHAAGNLDGKDTHVSVYLHLIKGPHDDKLEKSGHWPLRGTFTIELLNQLSDSDRFSCVVQFHHLCSECNRVLEGAMGQGFGKSRFISHRTLLHHNNNICYSKDSIRFRISYEYAEPPYQVAPVTFKVTHFLSQWLKNKETWYSSPFFAFDGGYLLLLQVHAAGSNDGEGTHVSVYLHLMKGPHDDKLEKSGYWPLRGTFTIELLNQFNESRHYSDKVTFGPHTLKVSGMHAGVVYGISQFISHDILLHSGNRYLKEDATYFRINYQSHYQGDEFLKLTALLIVIVVISLIKSLYLSTFFIIMDHKCNNYDQNLYWKEIFKLITLLIVIVVISLVISYLLTYFRISYQSYHEEFIFKLCLTTFLIVTVIVLLSTYFSFQSYHHHWNVILKLTALLIPIIVVLPTTYFKITNQHYEFDLYGLLKLSVLMLLTAIVFISFVISCDHRNGNNYHNDNQKLMLTTYLTASLIVMVLLMCIMISYQSYHQEFEWNEITKLTRLLIVVVVILLPAYFKASRYSYDQEFNWNEYFKLTTLLIVIIVIFIFL